ncbi:MAG: hypothetical protein ILNGONEN_00053 [Syntrophorhabdaceae bacterium]|nr:hypothetical protein [Syntrophorhabdaceae bacterium]
MDQKETNQLMAFVHWIQSFESHLLRNEAEVETRFVQPLFRHLGYPDECRWDKFTPPTYNPGKAGKGYEIDHIYFSASTSDKQGEDTSLVIVEAKTKKNLKGIKEENVLQARFYGDKLKPIFLVLTNGLHLKVLKRDRVQSDEIVFDDKIETLKHDANKAKSFYHQLNFETVKRIKEGYVADVLKHKEYSRIDRILRSYPDIQDILDRGDFEPIYEQHGNVVTFVKPKVAIEYELPIAFEGGSCKIEFSSVTRRGLKIHLTRKDILGDLLIGLHAPPDSQARTFINRIGDDTFKVRLGQIETVLSEAEANDLCSCVDRLGEDYKQIITETETILETWDYMPMKLEGIPGFRVLSVKPNLWELMKRFAYEFDCIKGNSEWHIFQKHNTGIRISHRFNEHAIIWPKEYREFQGAIFPHQDIDLLCDYSDWQLHVSESDDLQSIMRDNYTANWKQNVGPNGIWTARYINLWLVKEFIPRVLQQYRSPLVYWKNNSAYAIKEHPSKYVPFEQITNPKQLITYLRKIQEWLSSPPARKLPSLLIRPFYVAFIALARTAQSSTIDISYILENLAAVYNNLESFEELEKIKSYILADAYNNLETFEELEKTKSDIFKLLSQNSERVNQTEYEHSFITDFISRVFISIIESGKFSNSQAQLNATKEALIPLWQQCRFEIRHVFLSRAGTPDLVD